MERRVVFSLSPDKVGRRFVTETGADPDFGIRKGEDMFLEEKVDKLLELVSRGQRPANWEELLIEAPALSPEAKLALIKAMGFTRSRRLHEMSCVSLQGSGYICTCIWPASVWENPNDVLAFLHETYEERKAATEVRNKSDYE